MVKFLWKYKRWGIRHDKSNSSEVSTLEAKMTIEKTQNMLKSHSVLFKN
jgi:hypothetical protein